MILHRPCPNCGRDLVGSYRSRSRSRHAGTAAEEATSSVNTLTVAETGKYKPVQVKNEEPGFLTYRYHRNGRFWCVSGKRVTPLGKVIIGSRPVYMRSENGMRKKIRLCLFEA